MGTELLREWRRGSWRMTRRRWTTAAAVLALLLAAAYGGAVFGFQLGGPQFQARWAANDAYYEVEVLRALRQNEVGGAIQLLEAHLDSQILKDAAFSPRVCRLFLCEAPEPDLNVPLMRPVAEYRREFPAVSTDGRVREVINRHLATIPAQKSSPAIPNSKPP